MHLILFRQEFPRRAISIGASVSPVRVGKLAVHLGKHVSSGRSCPSNVSREKPQESGGQYPGRPGVAPHQHSRSRLTPLRDGGLALHTPAELSQGGGLPSWRVDDQITRPVGGLDGTVIVANEIADCCDMRPIGSVISTQMCG